MTEYKQARSGVLVGILLPGAFAALSGLGTLIALADAASSLVGGRPIAISTLIAAPVGLLVTAVLAYFLYGSAKLAKRWKRLHERPIMAWGTLGEARRSNHKINHRYLYRISLTVAPPQGGTYLAEAYWFFPADLRDVARPGARVVTRIDPEDPSVVVVDWDQTRASWGMRRA